MGGRDVVSVEDWIGVVVLTEPAVIKRKHNRRRATGIEPCADDSDVCNLPGARSNVHAQDLCVCAVIGHTSAGRRPHILRYLDEMQAGEEGSDDSQESTEQDEEEYGERPGKEYGVYAGAPAERSTSGARPAAAAVAPGAPTPARPVSEGSDDGKDPA